MNDKNFGFIRELLNFSELDGLGVKIGDYVVYEEKILETFPQNVNKMWIN